MIRDYYLDIAFEILIPAESKLSIDFERSIKTWGGVEYPQGTEEARLHYFKLKKTEIPAYILSLLPEGFRKTAWQDIMVTEGLGLLRDSLAHIETGEDFDEDVEVFMDECINNKEIFLKMLNQLIGNESKWAVIFEPDFDRIDEVLEGDINIVFQKIRESLIIDRKGYIIWQDEIIK